METPLSTRRVTRSMAAASARKVEESVSKSMQKSSKNQQQDRSALFDITNDSPIVGVAMGNLETPSSAVSKKRVSNKGQFARTPGSGETLLRGQVKTLLQRVEEEAELSKVTLENRPLFSLQGLIDSPINLVAPTPANTPQIFSLSVNADGLIPQVLDEMVEGGKEGDLECENVISRSLLFDFSEKSDCSCVVTHQGLVCGEKGSSTDEDDDASIWSIQVNASSIKEDDDEEEEAESCTEEKHYEDDEEYKCFGLIDDVCEEMSKISLKEMPKFEGKHIRFIYNSDGEIEGEEECETPAD